MNICLKRVDDENIIYIKRNDNIDNEIDEDIEIDINKNEIDFLYIINEDIILYSKRLLQIIKCLI